MFIRKSAARGNRYHRCMPAVDFVYGGPLGCAERSHKDLRRVTEADLAGRDALVHLAELSNDPLGQNNPVVTHQINHRGSFYWTSA
jgi:hypothetical protein